MDWWVVLQIMVGGIITVSVALLVEYQRKPRLRLKIDEPLDVPYSTYHPAKQARWLRLLVENKPLPHLFRWLLRSSANGCHGTITFHHLDGQDVFGHFMQARWSGSPEPLPIQVVAQGLPPIQIIDPVRMSPQLHRDILPGNQERLDIAARFDSDNDCYGWCNDNYFSNPKWRNADWQLKPDRYLVNITVTYSGQVCKGIFRLINDIPVNSFRLEAALPEDREKIH